jgi:FAD/FMN-containing dehydrogenase
LPRVFEIADADACAQLLRQAARERSTVSVDRPGGDIELSTRRLTRVLEHEWGDLTAVVEAGIRLSELGPPARAIRAAPVARPTG